MIQKPRTLLILLTGLNLLNYMDRFVLSAVLKPIKNDLGLSYSLAGSLGTVFLLGFFLTSPLFGALGDSRPRKTLIAAGIVIWSLATLATGLSRDVATLLLARVFVGVGEASFTTLAPTLIDDVVPAEKRSRWLAIFFAAAPVGSALGFLLGGYVGEHHGWREAFFVAGGPGIVLGLLCLLIREPPRVLDPNKKTLRDAMRVLWPIPLFRQGVLGYSAYQFAVGAFAHWGPLFLGERYKLDVGAAGFRFGLVTVVGGAIGTLVGGAYSDKKVRASSDRSEEAAVKIQLRICALTAGLAAPLAAACFLAPDANLFLIAAFFCELFVFASNAPVNAVVLRSVPLALRASAMALTIFFIHLLGDLFSPSVVGVLGDFVPIQWAMMALPAAFAVAAMVWGAKTRVKPLETSG